MAVASGSRQRSVPRWLLATTVFLGLVWAVLALSTRAEKRPAIPTDAQISSWGKPVLYHFTAEWCAPCRSMERGVFADDEVVTFVAGRFTRVDVLDRSREEGRNSPRVAELEQRYNVRAFPTLVVASPTGEELRRLQGYPGRQATVRFLRQGSGATLADPPSGEAEPEP